MPLLSTFGAASARGFGLFGLIKFLSLFSLRFNSASTDFLSRTPTSNGNRKTWTFSFWVKRSSLRDDYFFSAGDGTINNRMSLNFETDNTLALQNSIAGVNTFIRKTTQLFRDPSAWYHIVFAVDTTQVTASNRTKIYVNGSEVTSFSTSNDLTLNYDTYFNSTSYVNRIGFSVTVYFNGYMSQIYFVDGQALTPSSFGETDTESGIWIPKTYTGSYGTNGFSLEFENSASLGTDSSGNGNNWTLNNLTSIDQTTDAPDNNFATWNPLYPGGNQTFTEGNLQIATGTTGGSIGTIAVNTGKWYWEIKIISATALARIAGVFQLLGTNTNLFSQGTAYYKLNGNKDVNNVDSAYGASLTTNDIVGVAIDVDARSITFYKNGVSQGAIDLSSVYNVGDDITPSMVQSSSTNQTVAANFGNPPFAIVSGNSDANGFGNFEYAVPSGYYALCTKNLSEYA
jgi:hypothetical protein